MSHLLFRKATAADTDAIVALVNSAYRGESSRKGWTTEADLLDGARTEIADIIKLISTEGSIILLAEQNGVAGLQLLGSVHLERTIDDDKTCAAFLGMFAVDPVQQAGGIGKQMIAEAEVLVQQEWGAQKMLMDVIPIRSELIAFYERRGFKRTGKVRAFPVNPDLWTAKTATNTTTNAADLMLARMEKQLLTVPKNLYP